MPMFPNGIYDNKILIFRSEFPCVNLRLAMGRINNLIVSTNPANKEKNGISSLSIAQYHVLNIEASVIRETAPMNLSVQNKQIKL